MMLSQIQKNTNIPEVGPSLEAMNMASEPSLPLKNLYFEELTCYYVLQKKDTFIKVLSRQGKISKKQHFYADLKHADMKRH